MTIKSLYKLESILDNPKYEGFGMGEQPSLLGNRDRYDDLNWQFDAKQGRWLAPQLANIWQPLRVFGRVRPYNDFPCVMIYPAFSQRAVDVLREELDSNGELLPLQTTVGSYFLFNCTRMVDIIDLANSKIEYLNKHTILDIEHLEVFQDRLAGMSIFQIQDYPGRYFVTDVVARKIRTAKLEGFEFRKIWPLPRNIYWELHRKLPECHDELTAQTETDLRPIKGNTVVIRLELEGANPTPQESVRFEEIANQLDELLVSPNRSAKYYGSLEIMEVVSGEARYFLSCPDADELAKKLKPWIKALKWTGQKWLVKRYGEVVDCNATEERLKL